MRQVYIFTNIDEHTEKQLTRVNQLIDLNETKIHLIHYLNLVNYSYPGDMIVPFYPNDNQIAKTVKQLNDQLQKYKSAFPNLKDENFQAVVQGSNSAKRDAIKLLEGQKTQLAVCITPKKGTIENFFHSSFTDHLAAYAPCDVLMLRQLS